MSWKPVGRVYVRRARTSQGAGRAGAAVQGCAATLKGLPGVESPSRNPGSAELRAPLHPCRPPGCQACAPADKPSVEPAQCEQSSRLLGPNGLPRRSFLG